MALYVTGISTPEVHLEFPPLRDANKPTRRTREIMTRFAVDHLRTKNVAMPSNTGIVANVGVGTWIERRARADPDRIALLADDRSVTYDEFASRIRRLANGLRRLGVERGDRVAWLGPNHPAFLESFFAAGLLGTALAPVNHRLDGKQIESILADIGPRVLIEYGSTAPKTAFAPHQVIVSPSSPTHRTSRTSFGSRRTTRSTSGWDSRSSACFLTPPAPRGSRKASCSPTRTSRGTS